MKFDEYLHLRGMSTIEFARRTGLAPATAYRLNKVPAEVSWGVMLLVSDRTNNHVTPNDLLGIVPNPKKPEF